MRKQEVLSCHDLEATISRRMPKQVALCLIPFATKAKLLGPEGEHSR